VAKMKIKKVGNEKKVKTYKVNILLNQNNQDGFFVGDKVLNKECDLKGRITKIENNTIFVTYEDKTIERIAKSNANEVLSYVDDIQTVISPMSPQISNNVVTKAIDNLSKAGEIFNEEEVKVDKRKMRINEEYEKIKKDKQIDAKTKQIEDIINLGISKGIVDKDEFEMEKVKLSMMNERDFEEYKDNILAFNSKSVVTSLKDNEEDEHLTEGEQMLQRIKNGENLVASNMDFERFSGGSNDSRSLESIANCRNDYIPPKQYAQNQFQTQQGFTQYQQPPMINNLSNTREAMEYDKNGWMKELDWTLLSRN
jgi:hypothetical protein